MKKITLKLEENTYDIIIGKNILKNSGFFIKKISLGNIAYIITNFKIDLNYGKILRNSLYSKNIKYVLKLVKDTEKTKSVYVSLRLIKDLLKFDKKGDIFIIAFGGGVIGDLAGFTASIYKRGIPYIQIPTTLLAQLDSSIGGKTAVDLKEAKNMVGTFYQPSLVLIDLSLLKTLDKRQMRSGLAEAIKYGLIKDVFIFDYIEKYYPKILAAEEKTLEELVYRCVKIKVNIVEKDEKENKMLRTILNFGHTVGHAIEAASGYKMYSHGEAIGIGMLIALSIGKTIGVTSQTIIDRVKELMLKIGLPIKIEKKLSLKKIMQAIYYDKKFKGVYNRFVLLKDIGNPIIKENIPFHLIKETIKKYFS